MKYYNYIATVSNYGHKNLKKYKNKNRVAIHTVMYAKFKMLFVREENHVIIYEYRIQRITENMVLPRVV